MVPVTASSLLLHFLAKEPYTFAFTLPLIVQIDVPQALITSVISSGELFTTEEVERYWPIVNRSSGSIWDRLVRPIPSLELHDQNDCEPDHCSSYI